MHILQIRFGAIIWNYIESKGGWSSTPQSNCQSSQNQKFFICIPKHYTVGVKWTQLIFSSQTNLFHVFFIIFVHIHRYVWWMSTCMCEFIPLSIYRYETEKNIGYPLSRVQSLTERRAGLAVSKPQWSLRLYPCRAKLQMSITDEYMVMLVFNMCAQDSNTGPHAFIASP